ncbi:MAG: hypothetical protein ABL886_05540 [Rhodoglobus sp.]
MTDENKQLQEQVDRSGYPFNMAVAEIIRLSAKKQRWRVEGEEIPWSMSKDSGFIDVAIACDRAFGVIECKKVNNGDALVFLTRHDQSTNETRCRLELYVQELPRKLVEVMGLTPMPLCFEPRFVVADCKMPTGSAESSYCAAQKGGEVREP